MEGDATVTSVKVYSLSGQQVLAVQNQDVVSLSSHSVGAYLVIVKTIKGEVSRKKIIKK